MDFCAIAEYFEEKYDYSLPLALPAPRATEATGGEADTATGGITTGNTATGDDETGTGQDTGGDERKIPIWEGSDRIVSEEIRIIGAEGEKVDVMTFRGSFERDLNEFAANNPDFTEAVQAEDDETVETIMNERFYHRPKMFYSPDKLVTSYGIPAPTPTFVYGALGKKPLPTRERIVADTVDSIAARFNLRYSEVQLLQRTARLIADDLDALKAFLGEDYAAIFNSSQFRPLGGLPALARFTERDAVFDALRSSTLAQQSQLGVNP